MECMRAFSTYDAYSRAAPESRTEARARLTPRRPKAVTIVMIVIMTSTSMIENPFRLRVFMGGFCLGIIMVQKIFAWSSDHRRPLSKSGATNVQQVKL